MILSLENIAIAKNGRTLFQDLGLSILPGTALCVHGQNGIGKTSLLRAIANIGDFSGQIHYNGVNIFNIHEEYNGLIAYQGHHNALDLELTVFENLEFWAKLSNMEHAIGASFAVFNLSQHEETKILHLSQGWQKKVALTKLLLMQSTIWLLDEPFVNLDTDGVNLLINMIKVRCMNHGIVIFSSQIPLSGDDFINLSLNDYCNATQ